MTCPERLSEDCLTINVYAPLVSNLNNKLQPVMLFIHGGGFDQGAASVDLYDSRQMVGLANVVVVTFNYRLGILGFLATEGNSTQPGLAGNYAFRDQLLALQWVRDNAKSFGGDPSLVTLVGESAGAASVRAHLISPASKGYFVRAIIHSDPLPIPLTSPHDLYSLGRLFMTTVGCSNIDCLRRLNSSVIISTQKKMKHIDLDNLIQAVLPLTPMVDGKLIPMRWEQALTSGAWNKVPLIIGSTSAEGRLFVYEALKGKLGSVLYSSVLGLLFKGDAINVIGKYPPVPFLDNKDLFAELVTDYLFACPTRHLLDLLQPSQNIVYNYVFTHAQKYNGWGPEFQYCYGYPCHASDLVFEFDPLPGQLWNFTQPEQTLSRQMMSYYTNFMRNGDPNVGLAVPAQWPRWSPQSKNSLFFQTNLNVTTNYNNVNCNFWDRIGYNHGFSNVSSLFRALKK